MRIHPVVVALGLISFSVSSSFGSETKPRWRYQALVLFNSESAAKGAGLPKGFRAAGGFKELLVVESDTVLGFSGLEKLRSVSGVVAVQKSSAATPVEERAPASNEQCIGCGLAGLNQNSPSATSTLGSVLTAFQCEDRTVCANGISKWWAQDAVDSELMKQKVDELASSQTAKVAVVDSGFDLSQKSSFNVLGSVKVAAGAVLNEPHPVSSMKINLPIGEKTNTLIGSLQEDENGHGTMVSSVIAGAGRLGSAKNVSLAMYRVTGPDDSGETTTAILQVAAWRACEENRDPDGLAIVNMSWGGRIDESGVEREEDAEVTKELIKRFGEKGCLITKSSGNSAFRREISSNLDDAYLRVAAIDGTHELADFSTAGEISAPGAAFYVVESSQAHETLPMSRRCTREDANPKSPRRFINGTSFAAPMAAAVASQVVRVLKSDREFARLANPDRIRLVNRILRASTMNNSINGLRAVMIADAWNRIGKGSLASPEELSSQLAQANSSFCASGPVSCPTKKEVACSANASCLQRSRERLAICVPTGTIEAGQLASEALVKGDVDNLLRYNRLLRNSTDARARAMSSDLTRQTVYKVIKDKGYVEAPRIHEDRSKNARILSDLRVNFLKSEMVSFFKDCAKPAGPRSVCDRGLIENILKSTLQSSTVNESLRMGVDAKTGEDRGSGSTIGTLVELIQQSRKILGEQKLTSILNDFFTAEAVRVQKSTLADGSRVLEGRSLSGTARLLTEIITREPGDSQIAASMRVRERVLLGQMARANEYYRNKTQDLTIASEDFPTRASFDGMIDRNRDMIDEALRIGNVKSLAAIQVQYLIEKIDVVGDWKTKRKQILLALIKTVLNGEGWGTTKLGIFQPESDYEILELCMKELAKSSPSSEDANQLRGILEGASNLHALARMVHSNNLNVGIGVDLVDDYASREKDNLKYSAHPWFKVLGTESLTFEKLAQRVTLAVVSEEDSDKVQKLSHEGLSALEVSFKLMSQEPTKADALAGSRGVLPPMTLKYASRFSPMPKPLVEAAIPASVELGDRLVSWALELQFQGLTQSKSDRLLRSFLNINDEKGLVLLRKGSAWKVTAQRILDEKARQERELGAQERALAALDPSDRSARQKVQNENSRARFMWPKFSEETLKKLREALSASSQ